MMRRGVGGAAMPQTVLPRETECSSPLVYSLVSPPSSIFKRSMSYAPPCSVISTVFSLAPSASSPSEETRCLVPGNRSQIQVNFHVRKRKTKTNTESASTNNIF